MTSIRSHHLVVVIVCLISLFGSGPGAEAASPAGQSAKDRIDKAEEACIDKDPSTAGMTECAEKAYGMWDKELNRNYAALMKALSPKDRETLKAVQRKWIEYRDQEFKLIDAIYAQLEGSMYIPMRVEARIDIIRERALKLAAYLAL